LELPVAATFESFSEELTRLCARFEQGYAGFLAPDYSEARLRADFLDPFFRALGWDLENRAGLVQSHREVEIESRTDMAGRAKRADYLFRTDRIDRFICEAKKPSEELRRHAYQAKRYAWNKSAVYLAVLTDFEGMHLYIVGHKPHPDEPDAGEWRAWSFRDYPEKAREIWDLLARESVAGGSIDRLIDSLPKKAKGKGKGKQLWLIKPDRARALDTDFLNFLDEARQSLGSDLLNHNDRADLLEDNRLNEAVQRILDRLLFLRICEDRDIDTGRPLATILRNWRDRSANPNPRKVREKGLWADDDAGSFVATDPRPASWPLWRDVVAHFKALDRRPPSHIPFFNGNLFKEHFSETLSVSDDWIAGFLDSVSDEETPYLFNVIPVEILGTIYERFLGKIVKPKGRGATIEEKPEVRKAGGVYYTPRYIVDYIVEQTVGKLLEDRTPEKSLDLKILDPACGSGSFLIRAFERVCEHWQQDLKKHPSKRKREWCWVDDATGDVHLTTDLKRRILTSNIYGVDLDPGAVEVTQLSLYLKMLEGETRHTLAAERDLFGSDIALLPPLQNNIQCGNSLIASDFSIDPDELIRVRAFDWDVRFREIMKNGGFDAVIGNPPYRMLQPHNTEVQELDYLKGRYVAAEFKMELFHMFLQRGVELLKENGLHGYIVPTTILNNVYAESLRKWLMARCAIQQIAIAQGRVFEDADVHTTVLILAAKSDEKVRANNAIQTTSALGPGFVAVASNMSVTQQLRFAALSGVTWNILLNERNVGLISRLTNEFDALKDVSVINRGLITGNRDAYFSEKRLTKSYVPIIAGGDVHRYFTNEPSEFVRFERPDSAGGCWDAAVHLAAHKVVVRQIGIEPTASLLTQPVAVTGNIFTVRGTSLSDEKVLLALINSKVASFFWRTMFADFKSSFPQVTIFSLGQLPTYKKNVGNRPSETACHDRLVELVDKMLTLTPKLRLETNEAKKRTLQNAVEATDRQIDQLVYELYGLTPEEIALVEGEAKK
jgi:hypothetical protein